MQETFPLDRDDRILAKTPYSFDVSVWEIFWPLQVGASIEIAPPGAHRDPAELSRLIASKGVTTVHFVPSMLDAFLAYDWGDDLSCLKRVTCSGEALPRDLQDRFHESLPSVALHNLYGPTEAAIDVTHWHCRKADPRPFVPIGRAVANTRLYIVDRNLHQTGIGVPGEICIGGVQVALGYWNEPLLTEKAFLDDPFSGNGDRLYKTGDTGRFLDDGNIQFLGRKDGQEKIRGNRVELGEIETVLRAHPAVREAAVVVGTSASRKTKTLAAYFCPKEVSAASVRDHLAAELPGYMIPALLIPLEHLPHTPSGKIDRRVLLEMATSAAPLPEEESTAPSTELEKHLTALWQQVLGDRAIGARMNFFDLGGDSILLMQVYARLRHRWGDQLQLASMFQYPTIERLAWFLENGLESDGPSEKEKIESRAERVKSVRGRLRKRQR
jgi:acyl-coenzyme A synthetase/AMP-(fatty) acid ligase/aryl carrier-like protein